MKIKILTLLFIVFVILNVKAQNPSTLTIERTNNSTPSLNLNNSEGLWQFTGPRSNESNNNFSLFWRKTGSVFKRYFTVAENGFIGFGTEKPITNLDVRTTGHNTAQGIVISQGNSSNNRNSGRLFFENLGETDKSFAIMKVDSRLSFRGKAKAGTISGSELFSINSNGNFGIGEGAPTMKLQLGSLKPYDGIRLGAMFQLRTSAAGSNNFVMENFAENGNLYIRSKTKQDHLGDIILNDHGGNVGIGVLSPSMKLQLGSLKEYDGIRLGTMFQLRTSVAGSNNFVMENFAENGNLYIRSKTKPDHLGNIILNDHGGNVGIGVLSPSMKLQLGSLKPYDGMRFGTMFQLRTSVAGTNNFVMENIAENGNLYIRSKTKPEYSGDLILNDAGGNVAIGTRDTKGFKLGVNGNIAALEVKVASYNAWPDYVFKNNYNLPTLKEVEKHINNKGHLKNIPSASQVKATGFFLGEMDSKLLQKIEELTLYTIQQQKDIENQAAKIKALEKEKENFKKLKDRLSKLERFLNRTK